VYVHDTQSWSPTESLSSLSLGYSNGQTTCCDSAAVPPQPHHVECITMPHLASMVFAGATAVITVVVVACLVRWVLGVLMQFAWHGNGLLQL